MYINAATGNGMKPRLNGPAMRRNRATLGASFFDRVFSDVSDDVGLAVKTFVTGGAAQPGTTVVQTPSNTWIMPVAIGGVAIFAVLMLSKKR